MKTTARHRHPEGAAPDRRTHRLPHQHRPPVERLLSTTDPQTVAAATLARARARGLAASRRQAERVVCNASMRGQYDGRELRPFDQRAGAMDAYGLPSLINGRRVWRGRG